MYIDVLYNIYKKTFREIIKRDKSLFYQDEKRIS